MRIHIDAKPIFLALAQHGHHIFHVLVIVLTTERGVNKGFFLRFVFIYSCVYDEGTKSEGVMGLTGHGA
jgi:hypothetical protein